jgi:F-type H+-transporting ATPase subunit delta
VAGEATGVAGIADRYATALFELARDQGALDAVAADLTQITALVTESGDLRRLLRSPVIGRAEQGRAVAALLERAGIGELTRRFVGVTAANRRLFALEAMIAAFRAQLARFRGEVTAVVSSAQELTPAQRESVDGALRRVLGSKVSIETRIEPALLGGLVVRVGSRMFDSSLQSKLQRLQLAMKGAG